MKTERIGRVGAIALTVVGLLAVSWVLPPAVHHARRLCPVRSDGVPEAGAYAAFARRYGVECSVCHVSYPQLSVVGAKFRMAGYRMPDELGNEAKWSNWGDNTSVKFVESYKAVSAQSTSRTADTPSSNGFVNGGFQWFPIEGGFGKYMATNSEVDIDATGAVTANNLNVIAALPINADSFVTVRTGLMSAIQGYGANDRGVGALSPSFLPTPSQLTPDRATSFTYNGFNKAGEGLEIAYNWKDTHVSAQVTNGYNSFKNSTQQGEDNHLKDFSFFVNQFIGDSAIAAAFYNGKAGYSQTGAEGAGQPYSSAWIDNYYRGVLYATIKALPGDKLDLLLGAADGSDQTYRRSTNDASTRFHSMGWFATLQTIQHLMSHQLTSALSYGTSRASTGTAGNRVSNVTLAFAVPIENNKFDFSMQTARTQRVGTRDTIANTAQLQWEFMF